MLSAPTRWKGSRVVTSESADGGATSRETTLLSCSSLAEDVLVRASDSSEGPSKRVMCCCGVSAHCLGLFAVLMMLRETRRRNETAACRILVR